MPKEETKKLNLYQKLAKIRKAVEVIQKDKDGYGYKYVSEPEILSKLTAMMDKLEILLLPSIVPDTVRCYGEEISTEKKNKKTGEMDKEQKWEAMIYGDMVFTWVNAENPEERIDVPWAFFGQQADASQAFGSGLTYCTRYFLLKFFNIATVEDDPDNWRSKQAQAAKEEDALIAKEAINEVDKLAKKYVADAKDPDKAKKEVLAITSTFVKGGNYLKIDEPALATRLLTEISKLVGMKEGK